MENQNRSQTQPGPGGGSGFNGQMPPAGFRPPGWPFECFPLPGMDMSAPRPPPGYYQRVSTNILTYVPPFILVIGSIGNLITVIVILRQFRRLTSTALFLLTLAFSDTVFLLCGPLSQWIKALWEIDVREFSTSGCKMHLFLTYTCAQFSSWLLVCVTLQRTMTITWHNKYECTKRTAYIIMALIFLAIFVLNSHFFYGFGADKTLTPLCQEINNDEAYRTFFYDAWPWIDFAIVFAIPFILLILGNGAIVFTVYKSKALRRQMSIIKSRSEKTFGKDARRLTMILTLLSIVFFVSLTPVSVYLIYNPYWQDDIHAQACVKGIEYYQCESEKKNMVHTIVSCISYLNAALNFFMYVLGAKSFRQEIMALLTCKSVRRSLFGTGSFSGRSSTLRSRLGISSLRSSLGRSSQADSVQDGGVSMKSRTNTECMSASGKEYNLRNSVCDSEFSTA